MKKIIGLVLCGLAGLVMAAGAAAATKTSTATGGSWTTGSTWVGGVVPLATDSVVIATTGAGAVTTSGSTITCAGLTINSGSVLTMWRPFIVNGTTSITGTINFGSTGGTRLMTFNGAVTLNGGAVWNETTTGAAATFTFTNNFTNNATTFTAQNTAHGFSGTGMTLSGATVTAIPTVTFTGNYTNSGTLSASTLLTVTGAVIRLTNNGTITATASLAGTGGVTQGASATLNLGGTTTITTLIANAAGNTVNYNGAAQTVDIPAPATYYNLMLGGSGTKTMPATALTVTGNFTISGTATATALAALTVGGNWTENGIYTPGTQTVALNGLSAQTISGTSPVNFNNLTLTNAANPNITLATNVTVASALTGTVTLTSTCPTDYTLTSATPAQTLHSCPPTSVVNSINLANVSPTSAATVSWTVTFNKSVTGVDNTAFSLVASGVSGAYITSVTGSGTTWTVTANTGFGSGTLGLNQNGPGLVVPTLSGTFTGQVYTISATPALAEYRMDEASWNGTAGEVLDNSGSGNSAQSFNSANTDATTPAIAINPGTCRYGVFDNGGTITQGYLQTPLLDLTTDFTITAWIRSTNNTVSGQRILIDDQNNTGGYGFSLADGTPGLLRFYSRGITPVILDSTYTIANNTWYFVAAVADITNRIRTIYVYSAAGTLLASTSDAAAFTGIWGTDAGPVSIGGEVNGPPQTEPPATFHFRGNLDEVRVYQKVLNQNALASIAAQSHVCAIAAPDHLEILHASGTGLTCAASTLTIRACADAACATLYAGGVSGTLSATGTPAVNWDGTTGGAAGAGFVIPAGSSSVTKNVQVATAGSVVFSVASAAPTPTNPTTCNFGFPVCTFTANTAGFLFSNTSNPGNSYTIPAQVSGVATPTLYLRAVQALTTNPAVCTPAIINSTTSVNMGYACSNPATCQPGSLATINTTPAAPGGTPVTLTFDANGSAAITARYDDAGQITLNANKTVTPISGGTAVTLNGNSNAFVVAPASFAFSGITTPPIKAGNFFTATVTALNSLGATTPNFGKETSPENVRLTSSLVTPNPVTYPTASNPTPGNNVIAGTEFGAGGMVNDANGVATVNNLSWGEVGLITLTATNSNYLGSGLTSAGTSANIGRFIPDHFDTAVVATATVPMPCPTGLTCPTLYNGFIYSGQPFSEQVTARNLAGGTTANCHSAYGLSNTVNLTAWDALGSVITQNPGTGVLANNTMASTAFSGGVGLANMQAYTFAASSTNPTDIFLRAVDAVNTTVTSRLATPANSVEGGVKVVSGRVRLANAYGSELLPLSMNATAQYYNGSGWVTSSTDSVTPFDIGAIVPAIVTGPLTVGNLTAGVVVDACAASVFCGGVKKITLNSAKTTGSANICLNSPAYLQGMPACATGTPGPNAGQATFGVYVGNSVFIYRGRHGR